MSTILSPSVMLLITEKFRLPSALDSFRLSILVYFGRMSPLRGSMTNFSSRSAAEHEIRYLSRPSFNVLPYFPVNQNTLKYSFLEQHPDSCQVAATFSSCRYSDHSRTEAHEHVQSPLYCFSEKLLLISPATARFMISYIIVVTVITAVDTVDLILAGALNHLVPYHVVATWDLFPYVIFH